MDNTNSWRAQSNLWKCLGFSQDNEHRRELVSKPGMRVVLSRFSRVRLSAALWTVAHQASLLLGLSTKNTGVALPFSRGSSPPRDRTRISCFSCVAGRFFTTRPLGKPPKPWSGKIKNDKLTGFWVQSAGMA